MSQFHHHTKLHSKCYTCSIPISPPQKATLQMLHLQYPNFTTTQSYSPNVTLAVSQFHHHKKLHSKCYICSIPISPSHKATLQMLHLQYPNFSTTQSYTPNVTLAVSQFQHHTKLHSKCYILLVSFLNVISVCW
jgi:ribosomal protein L30/L7E